MEALQQATREGYEAIHLVADGSASLGYEGILQLPGPENTSLAPNALAALLRGSRVTILGLSPPEHSPAQAVEGARGDEVVPTQAFRAYGYLGASRQALPTILAPLGPLPAGQMASFRHRFYGALAEQLSAESAVARALGNGPPLPVALFLRHRLGIEFVRNAPTRAARPTEPTQVYSALKISKGFLEELAKIDSKYQELPDNISQSDVARREIARQESVENELSDWTEVGEAGNEQ
jgi:hypothetical protein